MSIARVFGLKGLAITAAISGSIAFTAGWKLKTWETSHKAKKVQDAEVRQRNVELAALKRDLRRNEGERIRLSGELAEARNNVRTVIRETVREVPKYVKDSTPDVDRSLDPNLVRLYNNSIGITRPRPGGPEKPAERDPNALREPDRVADGP